MIFVQIFAITILMMFGGRYCTRALGLGDRPGPDVPPRNSVPTILGVWALLSLIVIVLTLYGVSYLTTHTYALGLLVGSLLIGGLALLDEILEMRSRNLALTGDKTQGAYVIAPVYKTIGQFVCVYIALYIGGVSFSEIVIGSTTVYFPARFAYFVATIWCVGFINAVNRFDGVYALVSGMSSIGFLTLHILVSVIVMGSYQLTPEYNQVLTFVSQISLALTIISLICTWIEYKPLGLIRDVGTMFFGFALAYLALLGGAKIGTIVVVLSLILFDAVRVLSNRIWKHGNPFRGDYTHLHHRLLANNRSRGEVRVGIRSRSIFFMILILLQGTNRLNKLIICILMMVIFFGINIYLFWIKKLPDHLDLQKNPSK